MAGAIACYECIANVMNSLYLRLNLASISVLFIFLGMTGAVLDFAFVKNAKLTLREQMLSQLFPLISAATTDEGGRLTMPLPAHLPEAEFALPDSGRYAFIRKDHDLIWRSPSLAKRLVPNMPGLKVGEKYWREVALPDGNSYAVLGLGYQRMVVKGVVIFDFFLLSDLKPLIGQINDYRLHLWGGLVLTALFLFSVQILVSRWALNPLKSVGKALNAIETGVNTRIEGNYPREVQRLTDNINTLLTQERERQTRYRNALDNLAHSLKTPLAVLLAAVDETDHLPKVVQEQASRMRLTLERQLQRAGNASALAMIPSINLSQLVARISASLRKVYGQKSINIINCVPDELSIHCDEADIMEILGNLLDNAFKWCNSRIEIHASGSANHFSINIQDDGPGIGFDQISHVLKRGFRADESVPGTGIGLSLVADLVEAYQGRLRIEHSRLGGAAVFIELMQLTNR